MKSHELVEVIKKAISGDREAVGVVIEHYMPLINSRSVINSKINEDLKQHIILYIIEKLPLFVPR